MIFDFDDFGSNHIISDMCQTRDCRKELDELHMVNMNFKVTLFAVPGHMTQELLDWCYANRGWVELAVHGIFHTSNYECGSMSYEKFDLQMSRPLIQQMIEGYFVKGFKAPGWQISDDILRWLDEHGWWVADQSYNNDRRPDELSAYINRDGRFYTHTRAGDGLDVEAWHGHTWNCVGNGIEETLPKLKDIVSTTEEFRFISEVLA